MHARATTIQGESDRIDDLVGQVESQVLSILRDQDGFKGFTLLVDRSSGKCVGLSYWETEDAMEASEQAVERAREQAAEASGGSGGPTVEVFEVAIDVTN